MILSPENEERLDRIVEDMWILQSVYGSDVISPLLMEKLILKAMPLDMLERSEEDRAILFAAIGQGVNEGVRDGVMAGMNAVHGEMFPFGHPGQAIEISE